MDWSSIIVGAITAICALVGTYVSNSKTTNLMSYKIEQLEKKQDKHNSVIERVFHLEESVALQEEKIKVANHRIDDLERDIK